MESIFSYLLLKSKNISFNTAFLYKNFFYIKKEILVRYLYIIIYVLSIINFF